MHDHLINAIGSQQLSCLCLLDLSAAFDTIDHSILLTRLSSWFGLHGSVLNWFECRTCHLAPSMSDAITLSYPSIPAPVASPKAPFLVLCFSSCTLPLPPQHFHLLPFHQPSPLCRRHPTVFLILPTKLRLKHQPPAKCCKGLIILVYFACRSRNITAVVPHFFLSSGSTAYCWMSTLN